MPCDITSGFQLGCRDNTGGLKSIYILSGSISSISGSQGLITSISGSGVWYEFQLFRQTSNYSEELVATPENGTIVYNQTCNAVFFKMQTSIRNQVRVLAQNPNLAIIIETQNGSENWCRTLVLDGSSKRVHSCFQELHKQELHSAT
jgi:hypothetical protein